MIYKFVILSDEADDFVRKISIDSDATFLELQNTILDSVEYTKDQITSFFICDDNWEKEKEITLVEMDTSSEEDTWTMADTQLGELLDEEKQKLLFVFDILNERSFFMELHTIQTGKSLKEPLCTEAEGKAPQQIMSFDEFELQHTSGEIDESFYGDEEFDPSELDENGFNDIDMNNDGLEEKF